MRSIYDCSVAVLGGAGFLGSHMVEHLIKDQKCQVLVIDNLVVGRRKFIHPDAKFVHHDITGSEDYLREVLVRHNIKYAMNYIAFPYIPDSFSRPIHVFNINAMGALKVINAAQEAGCEGILQVSSAEIYGDAGTNVLGSGKISESDFVIPHSTYGASKAAIDALVQVRHKEAQTPVIALRQFNCLGERETHKYVVPEIISQLYKQEWDVTAGVNKGKPAVVRLGNNSFRDFQYAGDAVRMATELLEKGEFGEVYNMGSEDGIKIYDLAKLIGKLMGFESVVVEPDPARVRPWEIWHLQSDNSKLYSVIESRPQVSLEDALRKTIAYFVGNDGWDF